MLNYEVESYFKPDEVLLIQSIFRDPRAVDILRKVFLPSVGDANLPLEQALSQDIWLSGYQWQQIPADEAKILAVARQDVIKYIIGGLMKLKVIANTAPENPKDIAARKEQDSTK